MGGGGGVEGRGGGGRGLEGDLETVRFGATKTSAVRYGTGTVRYDTAGKYC